MNRSKKIAVLFFFTAVSVLPTTAILAQLVKHNQPLSSEHDIKAYIEVGGANFSLHAHSVPYVYEYKYPARELANLNTTYKIKGSSGFLSITTTQNNQSSNHKLIGWELFNDSDESQVIPPIDLSLCDKYPIDLNLSVGASKADLDFTGIKLSNLNLNTGACKTIVSFNLQNLAVLEHMKISTGASQLTMTGLGFANFNEMDFYGGVTDVEMDFTGNIDRAVKVTITIDAGTMLIKIPKDISVNLTHSGSFFSSIDLPTDFVKNASQYTSSNYGTTKGVLNMTISSGAGALKLEWIE
ncbi:hypothetical protein Ctha_2497 [Chloroherpeton thalassium ATCC 35110]|uniref:Cell wall-active antibiotics response LiaF-like C-terminal domain-containing protein n=1 Tax=Chloroherpeton thalassium (strain ATCC 35110 / GB-78) TaxID=517418 RepID=B3QXN1_CHLT3|nr:hypothetical protein [Chloroherpeton thalassium]ACF14946.1 hypothetical protein Ctha_2497 [Chloroherpeton thalassium ATCC 35110]